MDKATATAAPVRYAVRQVLDQEFRREKLLQSSNVRQARSFALAGTQEDADEDKENQNPSGKIEQALKVAPVKRDFFGRIINESRSQSAGKSAKQMDKESKKEEGRIWLSFHEGFSNAVRKPITLKELLDSF